MLLNRLLFQIALLVIAGGAQAQLRAPAERPDALMNAVTSEVLGTLRKDAAAGVATDVALLIELKILPLFDFRQMTRGAVARNWALASEEQQGALVAQFRALLVRTYSSALTGYRDEDIEYKPLRMVPGDTDALVRSSIRRRGAETTTIDYDMENTLTGWKVYDVKVSGVSLVISYRESFAAVVKKDGIDGLISSLVQKNRENDARPKAPGLPAAAGRTPS